GGRAESNWSYAWIPVIGPLLGAALVGLLYSLL
ncbi:MAG: aquaporin family protein, partial [Bacteroidetes bacterium]|nr:aquaporin family protein [Bacteroidota bacterium]